MSDNKRPTKAIIPAAGFGTRFLPQTKAMPKEMLPIIDKPIIQYVVEELVEAGIRDIIIVGNTSKRAIEDHFDMPNEDLLANLRAGGEKKKHLIEQVEAIAGLANFIYVRQKGPYGNAAPLLSAAHLIGDDEPFIYKWADDFFVAETSSTKQLIETHEQYGGGVFACKVIERDQEYNQYGIADGEKLDNATMKMSRIIEKPGKENAPTNLASVSNYLLPANFLSYVEKGASTHTDGEFTFQPFVQQMIDDGHSFYAREIVGGKFCDTGDKLEYLKTVFDFALKHPKLGNDLLEYVKHRIEEQ